MSIRSASRITILAMVTSLFLTPLAVAEANKDLRLVLQITVDGLRGDLLDRYKKNFSDGGFRMLMENGTNYTNAQYQHANTETIVGHATLATGTHPSQHGMIGNVWFDRDAGELAYNIEDPQSPLIPTRAEETEGEQVDPAQKKSRTQGRSPVALLAPTLADTLSAYFTGKSKIFSVSGKDRSAVAMAGKTGKAFWFSANNGDFVTSQYYYDEYPDWVKSWNDQRKAETYAGKSWELLKKKSMYQLGHQDDRPYEADLKGYGRVFPHPFGEVDALFPTKILVSPIGDKLALNFSRDLITHEELGRDAIPDYLSISFSGVDAVNHFFGASSLENEDLILQLDRTLAELFTFIDENVGLDYTLIVLSADHGMADMPEYMSELGFKVGRLDPDELIAHANKAGEKFGIEEVVRFFFRPYLYLDGEKIKAANVDRNIVEQAVADALTDYEGISLAVAKSTLPDQNGNPLIELVRNNHHASRSGDIYVMQEPYWFLFDKGPIAVMHGSPWRYDKHVPLIFSGPEVKSQTIHRLVRPIDISPTIANYLGITPPASSQGAPLDEVLQ